MRVTTTTRPALIGCAMMAMFSIPAAQAMDGMVSTGTHFTDVNIGMGQQSSGLYINGGWVKNNQNGREVAGAETGINLPVGPAMFNLGVQANYIKGSTGAGEGVVFPVGAGVKLPLVHGVGVYASAYSASRQLSNSAKNYLDVDGGLSWTPIDLVTLKAGYRYIGMDGKNNRPNERLVEGPYVAGQLNF